MSRLSWFGKFSVERSFESTHASSSSFVHSLLKSFLFLFRCSDIPVFPASQLVPNLYPRRRLLHNALHYNGQWTILHLLSVRHFLFEHSFKRSLWDWSWDKFGFKITKRQSWTTYILCLSFRLYQKEKQHFIVYITSLTAQKKCDKKLITVSDIISYEISDQQE